MSDIKAFGTTPKLIYTYILAKKYSKKGTKMRKKHTQLMVEKYLNIQFLQTFMLQKWTACPIQEPNSQK